jgi:hypothetical protein
MTRNDLLRMLLAAADDVDRSFDLADMAIWPPGSLDELQRLGTLRRSAGGMYATCPNCDEGHVEPVTMVRERFYISCPEALIVEVEPQMCERWEIDPAGLAAAVAQLLGLNGKPTQFVADRFWRLGRMPWPPGPEKTRPVVFVCRMGSPDASELVGRVPMDGRTIVLVPNQVPDERVWPGKKPPVIPLSDVLSWTDDVKLDAQAFLDLVQVADNTPYVAGGLEITHDDLQLMIRRQLKADKQTDLSDEAVLQALKIHGGNARAAAKTLNEEGYSVHHSTISRKFKRLREAYDIDREDDSASVSRTVASQPGDMQKKFLERR